MGSVVSPGKLIAGNGYIQGNPASVIKEEN
jgi:hypothetical protein